MEALIQAHLQVPPPKLLEFQVTMEAYNDLKPCRQSHVLQSNETACETAIGDSIHASYHPLNLGECNLFDAVITSARLTTSSMNH